jgi:glycosyltransferase involved in cell wall biosynthesis
MSRLVVQIPALNEAKHLSQVINSIPRQIEGIDEIQVLVIDDGSSDGTAQVALEAGADLVVQFPCNRGLAAAFSAGLNYSLAMGADVIVNTDGDNQYPSSEIPRLVAPILSGQADMVIGDRQPGELRHFSWLKQRLQNLGSRVVRTLTHDAVTDATSGFRAMSRQVAMNLNLTSSYTYTLESIFQASNRNFNLSSVVISVNETQRKSRLIKSIPSYLLKSARNILTFWTMYRSMQVFSLVGASVLLVGLFLCLRYLWFQVVSPDGAEHFAALVIGAVSVIIGLFLMMLALLADFMGVLRSMQDNIALRLKRLELYSRQGKDPESTPDLRDLMEGVRVLTPGPRGDER